MSENHKWYVIHVYSGFESKIVESIMEQAEKKGIADQFSELMVPAEEVVEVRRGKKYNAERKFFPGYILAKMELSDAAWNLVKNTQRVTGFLGGQGRPVPISEREAKSMLQQCLNRRWTSLGWTAWTGCLVPISFRPSNFTRRISTASIQILRCKRYR